jgi:hypothetical protein
MSYTREQVQKNEEGGTPQKLVPPPLKLFSPEHGDGGLLFHIHERRRPVVSADA